MNTIRYIVCGALTGYGMLVYSLLIWLPVGVLADAITLLIPVATIGGGYFGYWHAKKKQGRTTRVVQVLPERTQDSTHATAA